MNQNNGPCNNALNQNKNIRLKSIAVTFHYIEMRMREREKDASQAKYTALNNISAFHQLLKLIPGFAFFDE